MRHIALTAFIALALVAGAASFTIALAKEGPGTRAVRKANQTIARLLEQKAAPSSPEEARLAAQVTDQVKDFLDIDLLGRRALVDHWGALSSGQRKRFLSLLHELIEKNYVKGLRANLKYDVAYTGEAARGDDVVVSTSIKTERRGRPYTIDVEYVLRRDGNELRAWDVITDGVGLVDNYRAQFNKIIAKNGFDGLLARMQKKADALK